MNHILHFYLNLFHIPENERLAVLAAIATGEAGGLRKLSKKSQVAAGVWAGLVESRFLFLALAALLAVMIVF